MSTIFLWFKNVLLGAAILIFAKGFFPHKAVLPGLAARNAEIQLSAKAPFDKVIFMVVDALRSDFVYSNASQFEFTQSLIRSGAAIPFTGHASPPTITMPRVKAITTGSVPSFLDLVLNFAESDTSSTLAAQDSWLAQLKAMQNGKLVMYGDDTWLRLFPQFFARADGTTSFFVSDFTEVDNNVTRHVPEELKNDDWNGMILHFLGLDHIGHKTGPRGPNMPAKQREMDGIIQQIYEALSSNDHLQNSLLVLLGDHGMNEAGNHGANSAGEVSTALTFISPKFASIFEGHPCPASFVEDFAYYDEVDQSDVAPTLAALLGFPVPKNSLGVVIPKFLDMWTNKTDQYSILFQNAQQIQQVAYATYPEAFDSIGGLSSCTDKRSLTENQRLACKWFAVQEIHLSRISNQYMFIRDSTPLVRGFIKEAQSLLSGTASKYDEKSMLTGIGLAAVCVWPPASTYSISRGGFTSFAYFFTAAMYAITMFASSYVEEEHQFWYWITGAWLSSLAIRHQRVQNSEHRSALVRNAVVCLLFGVARRFNQTGQKYAGEADIITEVLMRYRGVLWLLVVITYTVIPLRFQTRLSKAGIRQLGVMPVLVTGAAFVFKVAFTAADAPELLHKVPLLQPVVAFAIQHPLNSLARLTFLGLIQLLAVALYAEPPWKSTKHLSIFLESVHDIVSLLLLTQTRTTNIPLFLIYYFQLRSLQKGRTLTYPEALITTLMLQYCSFFAFGGTNAISSVDLSNAYNGVGGYNVLAVGILTFVSNWAGPIWWASATACVLRQNIREPPKQAGRFQWFDVLTHFAAVHAVTVMIACFVLREHLFVWTVFSPKYLYMMAWTFAQHMVVNGLFSSIISAGG